MSLNPRQFGPLYHGTDAESAERILAEGFKPGTDHSRGAVWLARTPEAAASFAAQRAAQKGTTSAVLEVGDVRGVPSAYGGTRAAREAGDDLSDYGTEVAVHRPEILRSVRRHS